MNGYLFCTHVFVTVCLYVCVCDFVHLFGFCVRSGHLSVTIKTKLLVNHTLRSPNLHRNVKLLPYTRKKNQYKHKLEIVVYVNIAYAHH